MKAGHLEDVRITERQLIGVLKKQPSILKTRYPASQQIVCTRIPGLDAGPLVAELEAQKVKYSGTIPSDSGWLQLLLSWGPLLFFLGIYLYAMRRMQMGAGGPLSVGRNRAKIHDDSSRLETSFSDVAGVEEAKQNSPKSSIF